MTGAAQSFPSAGAVRRCARCGCRLARDNAGERCSPCETNEMAAWVARNAHDVRQREARRRREGAARAALDGGLAAVAEVLGVELEEAARVVSAPGVAPGSWRVNEEFVVGLVRARGCSHSAAARRLGVSRWTVATWRGRLGLDTHGHPTTS